MYRKCFDFILNKEADCIHRLSDNAFIPFDDGNVDYIEYLKWIAEGNEPEEWLQEEN